MNKLSRRTRVLIWSAVGFVLLLLFIYAFLPKTQVVFSIAPGQVEVSIDGKPKQSVKYNDKLSVSAGKHTITASQTDFYPYTTTIDVKQGETAEFLAALNPLTEAAKQLLTDDNSQSVIQRFYGKTFTKQTETITKQNPIISILPINARLYTVYACGSKKYPNDPTKIGICADMYHADLIPYIEKDIKSRGFNPADYEMIYIDKYTPNTQQD